MKKFFGILGSAILCAVVACACLVGCGDKTPKTETVSEWNMGVTEDFTIPHWKAVEGTDNMEIVDNADAKDGKALKVTVASGGGVSFLCNDNHGLKSTAVTLRIYSDKAGDVTLNVQEAGGDWEQLFMNEETATNYATISLTTGWNDYTLEFKRAVAYKFNNFVFKSTQAETVEFLVDTITFTKPVETE